MLMLNVTPTLILTLILIFSLPYPELNTQSSPSLYLVVVRDIIEVQLSLE